MEHFFGISRRGSTVRREVIGGITTFFAMAYIIFVNPNTLCPNLGTAAEPFFPAMPEELWGPVLVATCVAAAIGCFLTGLLANVPFAQAPGMGLNAFFTYTVCLGIGYTWQEGLAIVLLSGLLFLAISVSPLRKKLIAAIPDFLKHAISAGIGLFIAFIGLLNVGLISISGAVPALQLSMLVDGQRVWNTQGLLTLVGLLITAILMTFRVKGAVVIGILVTTLLGLPAGVTQIPESVTMEHVTLAPVFFQLDLGGVFSKGLLPLLTAVISFAIVDCFDTLGALVGLSSSAGLEDHDGRADRALIADAMATCCGACIGTSTVTTFAESSTGIAEGARTGLSSMVVGVLFLFSVFLAPVAGIIPAAATAPALIIVGVLTMRSAVFIPWEDAECAVPAFLTIAVMPFAYSISDGIAFGFISYSLIKLIQGKGREVSLLTYGISLVFILKYLLGNMV
ncbi:NCS2 family permease [Pseudoflavonifractor phocaeensis]|uniref:NCS2 family permease n=1 Tax=Pseudoflavonifractor phocaeensis TaxID=1870988 RepID=UPI00195B7D65|nr:NCS2 family permease [Pseudoflavonifractor phocaeensis]MBM6926058.1 NCS2 family permease [Pseudoflavonifractor phocaeensis]